MIFVKAKVGPPNIGDPKGLFTVQYFDEKGNMTIRSGGSRAWRCNNPGNLLASSYSRGKSRRSIGKAGDERDEYAVYPDYETGIFGYTREDYINNCIVEECIIIDDITEETIWIDEIGATYIIQDAICPPCADDCA